MPRGLADLPAVKVDGVGGGRYGCGIAANREKLFLPYLWHRETGLGLAIVNHVLGDHRATIRVVVEFPVLAHVEAVSRPLSPLDRLGERA